MSEERRIQFMLSNRGGISECPPVHITDSYYLDKNTKSGNTANQVTTYPVELIAPDSWKIDFGEYRKKNHTEIYLAIGFARIFQISNNGAAYDNDFPIDTVQYPDFDPTDTGYYPRTLYFEMVDAPMFLMITQNGNSYLGASQDAEDMNLFSGGYCDIKDKNMRTIFPDYKISFSNYNDWILLQ